jgi:hypothetical protein
MQKVPRALYSCTEPNCCDAVLLTVYIKGQRTMAHNSTVLWRSEDIFYSLKLHWHARNIEHVLFWLQCVILACLCQPMATDAPTTAFLRRLWLSTLLHLKVSRR